MSLPTSLLCVICVANFEAFACLHCMSFIIFSCFLLCRTGTSFILRLPCKSESDFQVKVVGRRLANHMIAQVTAKSVNECYQKCEDQDGCKSVNYRGVSSENCQLNKKIRETAERKDFEASDSWEYHATSYNTTNVRNIHYHVFFVPQYIASFWNTWLYAWASLVINLAPQHCFYCLL